jgi:hypothetical protein
LYSRTIPSYPCGSSDVERIKRYAFRESRRDPCQVRFVDPQQRCWRKRRTCAHWSIPGRAACAFVAFQISQGTSLRGRASRRTSSMEVRLLLPSAFTLLYLVLCKYTNTYSRVPAACYALHWNQYGPRYSLVACTKWKQDQDPRIVVMLQKREQRTRTTLSHKSQIALTQV